MECFRLGAGKKALAWRSCWSRDPDGADSIAPGGSVLVTPPLSFGAIDKMETTNCEWVAEDRPSVDAKQLDSTRISLNPLRQGAAN